MACMEFGNPHVETELHTEAHSKKAQYNAFSTRRTAYTQLREGIRATWEEKQLGCDFFFNNNLVLTLFSEFLGEKNQNSTIKVRQFWETKSEFWD